MVSLTMYTIMLILLSLVPRATTRRQSKLGPASKTVRQSNYNRRLRGINGSSTDVDNGCYGFEKPDIKSEKDFVQYCQDWFVPNNDNLSQAFISQGGLVDFLASVCLIFDEKDLPEFDCPAPTFTSIALDVQLVFIEHVCDVKVGEEMIQCLKSAMDKGKVFGYDVNLKRSPFAENLCCGLLPFISVVSLERNSGCPGVSKTYPSPEPSYFLTSRPGWSGQVSSSPVEWSSGQGPSSVPTSLVGPKPPMIFPSPFSPIEPSAMTLPTSGPSKLPSTSGSIPSPVTSSLPPVPTGPTPEALNSNSPTASWNPSTEETVRPSPAAPPTQVGNPVVSKPGETPRNEPSNTVSVATITGIVVGLGGLCIVAAAVSRRRARKQAESELSHAPPDETSSSSLECINPPLGRISP